MFGVFSALPVDPGPVLQRRQVKGPLQAGFVGTLEASASPVAAAEAIREGSIDPDRSGRPARHGSVPMRNADVAPWNLTATTGRTSSKASSSPNRWFISAPSVTVTPRLRSMSSAGRTAAPKIVSPFAKRISELGIVAVEHQIRPHSKMLLPVQRDGRRSRQPQDDSSKHTRTAREHALYDSPGRLRSSAAACCSSSFAHKLSVRRPWTTTRSGVASWHLELGGHAALETWNYNTSHEELFGMRAGLSYGLGKGITLLAGGSLYYVDQRGVDGCLMDATVGIRGRVFRRGRVSLFLEGEVGVSESDTYVPPRGTRFNYVALGADSAQQSGSARVCICSPG